MVIEGKSNSSFRSFNDSKKQNLKLQKNISYNLTTSRQMEHEFFTLEAQYYSSYDKNILNRGFSNSSYYKFILHELY